MTERWLPLVGWEGRYEISDHGRVRGVDRTVANRGTFQPVRGCVLAQTLNYEGRPSVQLRAGPRRKNVLVHRAVLTAFVGPRPPGLVCCHNDGDPTNNHLTNLRWDTYTANQYDAVRHGDHGQARKTHCPRGHAYAGDNLGLVQRPGGRVDRRCNACGRAASRARRDTKRNAAA